MQYERVILGATFAAAGLVFNGGSNTLVIESKPQAGYEFIGALNFGTGYDEPLKTQEARALYEKFKQKGAFADGKACLFDCASILYSYFLERDVLLCTNIVKIDQNNGIFRITVHGVKGFRTFYTKEIIDTRCNDDNILKKAFHAWIRPGKTAMQIPENLEKELLFGIFENTFILKLNIEKECTYPQARKKLDNLLKNELSGFKLGLSADCFAVTPKQSGVFKKEGMVQIPSCGFCNPLQAFDAGIILSNGRDM